MSDATHIQLRGELYRGRPVLVKARHLDMAAVMVLRAFTRETRLARLKDLFELPQHMFHSILATLVSRGLVLLDIHNALVIPTSRAERAVKAYEDAIQRNPRARFKIDNDDELVSSDREILFWQCSTTGSVLPWDAVKRFKRPDLNEARIFQVPLPEDPVRRADSWPDADLARALRRYVSSFDREARLDRIIERNILGPRSLYFSVLRTENSDRVQLEVGSRDAVPFHVYHRWIRVLQRLSNESPAAEAARAIVLSGKFVAASRASEPTPVLQVRNWLEAVWRLIQSDRGLTDASIEQLQTESTLSGLLDLARVETCESAESGIDDLLADGKRPPGGTLLLMTSQLLKGNGRRLKRISELAKEKEQQILLLYGTAEEAALEFEPSWRVRPIEAPGCRAEALVLRAGGTATGVFSTGAILDENRSNHVVLRVAYPRLFEQVVAFARRATSEEDHTHLIVGREDPLPLAEVEVLRDGIVAAYEKMTVAADKDDSTWKEIAEAITAILEPVEEALPQVETETCEVRCLPISEVQSNLIQSLSEGNHVLSVARQSGNPSEDLLDTLRQSQRSQVVWKAVVGPDPAPEGWEVSVLPAMDGEVAITKWLVWVGPESVTGDIPQNEVLGLQMRTLDDSHPFRRKLRDYFQKLG